MSTYHQPTNVPALQAAIANANGPGWDEQSRFDAKAYSEKWAREFGANTGLYGRSMRSEQIKKVSPGAAMWTADHHAAKVRHAVLRELENNYGFGGTPPMPGINRGVQCRFARELPEMFRDRLEAVFTALEHNGFDRTRSARNAFNSITRRFMDALDAADERTANLGKGRAKARVAEYQCAVAEYIEQLDDWFTALKADFFGGGTSSYWHAAASIAHPDATHIGEAL